MTYLKTSWFSFGNFLSTSLRACNFCSRSLISEERENRRLSRPQLVGVTGSRDSSPGQVGRLVGWGLPRGGPGLLYKVSSILPPRSLCPRLAHLAVAPTQQPGLPLGSQAPAEGEHCVSGLPGPHHPQLSDPQRLPIKKTILRSSGCPWRQECQCGKPACFLTRRVSTATHPRQQAV